MGTSRRSERDRWEERYAAGERPDRPPSAWVAGLLPALPNDSPLIDVAGGSGRHALLARRAGFEVVLADVSVTAIRRALAADHGLRGVVADARALPFAPGRFGVVLVTNFLDRSAFDGLRALLAPGGYLVYETYTTRHLELVAAGLARGPTSREYLLEPGELPTLAAPLAIERYEEGEVTDDAGRRHSARLIARRARTSANAVRGMKRGV